MSRLVAFAGLFDLDDLGPQIAKNLRGPRPCEHTGEVQHANMRKRTHLDSPRFQRFRERRVSQSPPPMLCLSGVAYITG